MNTYETIKKELLAAPRKWLVTGDAGFIGSNLVEALLKLNQMVVGLDNYSTGKAANLDQVRDAVGPERWRNFQQMDGSITDLETCRRAAKGVCYVLHQAALGSVPRSLSRPTETNDHNVGGFVNMLAAARENAARRFVYASSSSVYGDAQTLPQVEAAIGRCLSPYAVSKRVNELYADVFAKCYGMESVGLRYFNVFGPRQDPEGAYAAVIPKWVAAMLLNEPIYVNGDGSTSRDFCYIANVVQANLLAAVCPNPEAVNRVYNVALGRRTSLNQLFEMIRRGLAARRPGLEQVKPVYRDFRPGDILHSEADIRQARRLLGYEPSHSIQDGLNEALDWYAANVAAPAAAASTTRKNDF
jgi:UDP-N-acetylglucosamine 4-epimerase